MMGLFLDENDPFAVDALYAYAQAAAKAGRHKLAYYVRDLAARAEVAARTVDPEAEQEPSRADRLRKTFRDLAPDATEEQIKTAVAGMEEAGEELARATSRCVVCHTTRHGSARHLANLGLCPVAGCMLTTRHEYHVDTHGNLLSTILPCGHHYSCAVYTKDGRCGPCRQPISVIPPCSYCGTGYATCVDGDACCKGCLHTDGHSPTSSAKGDSGEAGR